MNNRCIRLSFIGLVGLALIVGMALAPNSTKENFVISCVVIPAGLLLQGLYDRANSLCVKKPAPPENP
jgi:hypothetical protein